MRSDARPPNAVQFARGARRRVARLEQPILQIRDVRLAGVEGDGDDAAGVLAVDLRGRRSSS